MRKTHGPATHNRKPLTGFTIVETMIVLAVTGVFFIVAAVEVGGRQNETEFQQSINDIQSSLQKTINDVVTGDFQEANNITCSSVGGKVSVALSAGPTNTEGTNADCIFIGKVLQFTSNTGSNPQEYISYPVAGLENNGGSITTAAPVVVAPDNGMDGSFPDDGVPTYLHDGLSVVYARFVSGSTTNIGAFGIMGSLGANPGAQQLYLVPVSGTSFNYNPQSSSDMATAATNINQNLVNSYNNAVNLIGSSNPNYSVQICFASGTTNESGLVTIGGNGGDLNSVTTTISSGKTC
jgi:Tfp pilus assembly protein PilE